MTTAEKASAQKEVYYKRMLKPTSKADLSYMLGDAIKIIKYHELENFSSLKDLLDPYQAVILLYPNANEQEVGHWCCLFQMPGSNILQYFDSYGCFIDDKVKIFNQTDGKVLMHEMNRISPTLLKLILDSPYADSTYWNEYQFQSNDIATSTCGLWVVLRLKNNHLNEEGFKKQFLDLPKSEGTLPDLLVAALICKMFPELK